MTPRIAVLLIAFVTSIGAQAEVRLGIEPRGSVAETVRMFTPLADYLTRELGRPVQLEVPAGFDAFGRALADKRYDLAFAAPATILYHAPVPAEPLRWLSVAVDRGQGVSLRGIFITRQNAPLEKIEDLKGKRIAYVDKSSQGYLVLSQLLREAGVDPQRDVDAMFTNKLEPAVRAVLENRADAAGVGDVIFTNLKGKLDLSQIRVIVTSPPIPNWAMVAFDAETGAAAQKALLKLAMNSPAAAKVLGSGHFAGFQEFKLEELDVVQRAVRAQKHRLLEP